MGDQHCPQLFGSQNHATIWKLANSYTTLQKINIKLSICRSEVSYSNVVF